MFIFLKRSIDSGVAPTYHKSDLKMAECVQYRCEEMMPELEQMEKLKLFDKLEIRAIVKSRKDNEYKIQKRGKIKEDYLKYIQNEMDLLKLIRLKREHLYTRVSSMLEMMLQTHSDKPHMYKLAANWEFEQGGNIEKARRLTHLLTSSTSLSSLPPPASLSIAQQQLGQQHSKFPVFAFRLELINAAALRKQKKFDESAASEEGPSTQSSPASLSSPSKSLPQQQQQQQQPEHEHHTGDGETENTQEVTHNEGGEEEQEEEMDEEPNPTQQVSQGDKVANGCLAEVIYENAIKKLSSAEFITKLLSIAARFDFTHKLQECIVKLVQ
ncbi:hypothetical protein B566_EDAN012265 [Ephemera danica]|nr:hypothetical protein B566_EDAN012265 [Ephemera danica]